MEKLSLKKMIINEIDSNPRGYVEELAKVAGYGSGSSLKKVLLDPKKEFDKFCGLILLVRHLWGNDSVKMMLHYSKEVDPNKKNARNLLEFMATAREFEAFNELLDKMDKCSNKESQEWSRIYRLQYKYELSQTDEEYKKLLREISLTHVTVSELLTYQKMLLNYCYNQLNDYNMVKTFSSEIEQEIKLIDNDYIKEMYAIRSNEIMSYNNLKVYNNPEAARKCTEAILESSARPAFKAYAYFIKGYSYLFTSYEKTIENLNKSAMLYESINRKNDVDGLKEIIEFVNVYWDKLDNNNCRFIKNHLLFEIKKGRNVSNDLLREKDKMENEFYLYLDGINNKNNKTLILSLIEFVKKNNLFLANLAKIELLKNGYDNDILEAITGIKA